MILISGSVWGQSKRTVSFRIFNGTTREVLGGATIMLAEKKATYICDTAGRVQIGISLLDFPIYITVTSLGYEDKKLMVNEKDTLLEIPMRPVATLLQEVVFSASRTPESILRSPVSVEKMNLTAIRDMAAVSLQDELRQIKGIEVISTGLNFKQTNSRGFANTFSWRFLQLSDDMDNMSPALGWSLANIFSTPELDVAGVELIPGAASALYGPIAFTGLLHTRTKDPFRHQGLSVQWKTGINHVGEVGSSPKPYNEIGIRYAKKINERWAYKINLSYMRGIDFYADDSTDVNVRVPIAERGVGNPARDGLNIYGDEVQRVIPGVGLVSRTGYAETSFGNFFMYSLRTNAALHYRINDYQEIILQQNFSNGNANFTGTSRFNLLGVSFLQSKIEWKGKNFFLRGYRIGEHLGDSYNTRSLSQLMNQQWVRDLNGSVVVPSMADEMWFKRYEAAYKGNVSGVSAGNHPSARAFADEGRWLPGSQDYELAKERISHTYEGKGAAYYSRSAYYHAEGQYTFKNLFRFMDVLAGGNIRRYDIFSRGTLYADQQNNLRYNEFGLFVQGSKELFQEKLKVTGSVRLDKNPNFKANFSPRISGVLSLGKESYLRGSYQTGFRNPSSVEQFINIKIGQLTLLGGAPQTAATRQVYQGSFTTASVEQYLKAVSQSLSSGVSVDAALEQNKSLLKSVAVPSIRPELQHTYELGYRGEWFRKLVVDFNIDYSSYYRFSVNAFATKPISNALNADGTVNTAAARQILNNQSSNYQLYTNSGKRANAIFLSAGISYFMPRGYRASGNITYSKLRLGEGTSVNEIAPFNTPPWAANLSFWNNTLYRNLGFKINWHWQDTFDWYGTFNGNRPGNIKAFSLLDLSIQDKIPKKNMVLKIGANNLLNHRVMQSYGSPRIGAIYYFSLVFEPAEKH